MWVLLDNLLLFQGSWNGDLNLSLFPTRNLLTVILQLNLYGYWKKLKVVEDIHTTHFAYLSAHCSVNSTLLSSFKNKNYFILIYLLLVHYLFIFSFNLFYFTNLLSLNPLLWLISTAGDVERHTQLFYEKKKLKF